MMSTENVCCNLVMKIRNLKNAKTLIFSDCLRFILSILSDWKIKML